MATARRRQKLRQLAIVGRLVPAPDWPQVISPEAASSRERQAQQWRQFAARMTAAPAPDETPLELLAQAVSQRLAGLPRQRRKVLVAAEPDAYKTIVRALDAGLVATRLTVELVVDLHGDGDRVELRLRGGLLADVMHLPSIGCSELAMVETYAALRGAGLDRPEAMAAAQQLRP